MSKYIHTSPIRDLLLEATFALSLMLQWLPAQSQSINPTKEVFYHEQSWISINSTMRFSNHWGLMADFHMRRNDFLANNYFYFTRLGAVTWISGKYPVAFGVAHMWQAPKDGGLLWVDENRIFQQWSGYQREGMVSILHRIRLEQRWRDLVVNDTKADDKQFSVRLRYLASFETKIFKDPGMPSLVFSDEILVQFGREVLNTFDQNRLFVGIKFPIVKNLSCDLGYMNVFQQRITGYQYDSSDVFRFFLYYNLDFRKDKGALEYFENTE